MEKFTQKWTLISLVEPENEGYEFAFTDWPLHITIAATFEIDWENTKAEIALQELCNSTDCFSAKVLNDEYLGPSNKPVLVSLIEKDSGLQDFHEKVINILESYDCKFKRPEHNKDNYIAHATVQKRNRLHEGETTVINNLALVDMFPGGDGYQRKIIRIFSLHSD